MSDCAAFVPLQNRALRRQGSLLALVATSLMLGACSQGGSVASLGDSMSLSKTETGATADAKPAQQKSELGKALEYWGKKSRDNPRDLEPALNFARNLKAAGQKQQALEVLQQAAIYHGNDRSLASEYGRLALEMDQLHAAEQTLSVADDPANPDWRVISARGTVQAKKGNYSEAIPFYERALKISENQPSVLNNLALAYTMSGEPQKAEQLLRQASAGTSEHNARIKQNLALVLGVQGRHDEAKQIATKESNADMADNATLMAQIVKAPSVQSNGAISPGAEPGTMVGGWSTRVTPARPAR